MKRIKEDTEVSLDLAKSFIFCKSSSLILICRLLSFIVQIYNTYLTHPNILTIIFKIKITKLVSFAKLKLKK